MELVAIHLAFQWKTLLLVCDGSTDAALCTLFVILSAISSYKDLPPQHIEQTTATSNKNLIPTFTRANLTIKRPRIWNNTYIIWGGDPSDLNILAKLSNRALSDSFYTWINVWITTLPWEWYFWAGYPLTRLVVYYLSADSDLDSFYHH